MDEVWRLYYALTQAVEQEGLPLLDQLHFSDFITLCRKHTSTAVAKKGEDQIHESMFVEEDTAQDIEETKDS